MVECARCSRDVETVQNITPDIMTNELIDSIDHGEQDLAEDGEMEICAECMDELKND